MSHVKIKRYEREQSITLHTTTTLATTLRLDDMAGGMVSLATMSTNATSLQCWGCNTVDGEYRRVFDATGAGADITLSPSSTVARMYSLPDAVFAVPFLKLVSATTNSTGTVGVVMFKS